MKAKHDMKEAIQQAVFNVRLCVPVKYKKFHDLRENDNILIVDFPLKQWTDVVGNEFTKQFARYDGGFIETLKLYAKSNYNDFLLYPADEHKILMGVQFHNTEHIKRLVDVLAALSGEKTQGEQAAPSVTAKPVELSNQQPEPMAGTIPVELSTDRAQRLLNEAAKAGFISVNDGRYKWEKTKALCAYFVDKASEYLQLKAKADSNGATGTSWKPFEQLFSVSGLSGCKNEWKNKTGAMPRGYKDIDRLFSRLQGK